MNRAGQTRFLLSTCAEAGAPSLLCRVAVTLSAWRMGAGLAGLISNPRRTVPGNRSPEALLPRSQSSEPSGISLPPNGYS